MKEVAGLEVYDDGSFFEFPYGSDWRKVAKQARERDNYECQNCGMPSKQHHEEYDRDLQVHHLYKVTSFIEELPEELRQTIRSGNEPSDAEKAELERVTQRAHDLTNLVTVCIPCHTELEALPIETQVEQVDSPLPKVQPPS